MKSYSQVHLHDCLLEGESSFELCQTIGERAHEINVSGESTIPDPRDDSPIILAMREIMAAKQSSAS